MRPGHGPNEIDEDGDRQSEDGSLEEKSDIGMKVPACQHGAAASEEHERKRSGTFGYRASDHDVIPLRLVTCVSGGAARYAPTASAHASKNGMCSVEPRGISDNQSIPKHV
jgi:hypothetical protein